MSDHNSPQPEQKMNWVVLSVVATVIALILYAVVSWMLGAIDESRELAESQAPEVESQAPTSAEPEVADMPAAVTETAGADEEPAEEVEAAPADGKEVYTRVCAACHQPSGTGVPKTFPPLVGSEWVSGDAEVLVKVILKGLQGPITVKGESYNSAMPPWEASLTDAEVAAVATYIRESWGNGADPVDTELAARLRKELKGRAAPFTADELQP